MQSPQSPVSANFNQLDNQERTQLTSGGMPSEGEFKAGDIVDGTYEIISLIGSGGMGNVYKARHNMMNQEYALKTLSSEQVNETAWRRFQNEAQAIARMNHANVVGIYNLGLHDGRLPFYVMDLLRGQTLLDILRSQKTLGVQQALTLFSEVASGIGYAHKKGIVHRDLKPGNIVIMESSDHTGSCIKIVDFGIAKLSGLKDQRNQELTSAGEICGSPYYMSPEQCAGGRVDTRSDVYSFGCTLFEALTGNPPYRGRSAVETMLMHQNAPVPTLQSATGKQFPSMLEQAIATMLAKAPMDRYQKMELIIQDFAAILEGRDQPINPYITSSHKKLESHTARLDRIDAEAQEALAMISASTRPTRLKMATTVGLTVAIGTAIIASAAGLYSFLTPKTNHHLSSMHFVKAATLDKAASKADPQPAKRTAEENCIDNSADIYSGISKALPGLSDQTPTASQKDVTPYAKIVRQGGREIRLFNFPSDFSIGTLSLEDHGSVVANGTLPIPADVKIQFHPVPNLAKFPQYCDRFNAGDIYAVEIGPPSDDIGVIKAIARIKGLQRVRLNCCSNLSDDCLDILGKIPTIKELFIDDSGISGKAIARMPQLRQLTEFGFAAGTDASPILEVMAGSTNLRHLSLQSVDLNAVDFARLATFKNLRTLNLKDTQISPEALAQLAKLPHLAELSIQGAGITTKEIAILQTFPALRKLHVFTKAMSPYVKAQFGRGLPQVEVE